MKFKKRHLTIVASLVTIFVAVALLLFWKDPSAKDSLISFIAPAKSCQAHSYTYEVKGEITGISQNPSASSQKWPLKVIPLTPSKDQGSDEFITAIRLGTDERMTFFIWHSKTGVIQKVERRSDMPSAAIAAVYPLLTRLPLLRAELLDQDSYEDISHAEFDFEASGTLRQTGDSWIWEATTLNARPTVPGGMSLSNMRFQYVGYVSPGQWQKIEGTQSLRYGFAGQSIAGTETFLFSPEPATNESDCTPPSNELLASSYIPVDFQKIQSEIADESQKRFFAENFDVSTKLQEARSLSRSHVPGQESPRELLKALSDLSQYYHHFPDAQKNVLDELSKNLADSKANAGERLFLTDLGLSFNSEASNEAIFQLLQEDKIPGELLENHVIAAFNHFEKPTLDMYRFLLAEYQNEGNSIDKKTTSLLAAASVAGHFDSAAHETTDFLKKKLSNPATDREEKNLAMSALSNIDSADSLAALWEGVMNPSRELAEEAILGIARSTDPSAEKLLLDIINGDKFEAHKKVGAAFGIVRRTQKPDEEDAFRLRLDSLYRDQFAKKASEELLSILWNGTLLRGFIYNPELRQSHNQKILDTLAAERPLSKWEKNL